MAPGPLYSCFNCALLDQIVLTLVEEISGSSPIKRSLPVHLSLCELFFSAEQTFNNSYKRCFPGLG